MMRVDAHHHIWRVARGDYGWLTADLPIYRDYTLDDLRPLLGEVDATVLIQAAPSEAETTFMVECAQKSGGLVQGVVGWVDFTATDAADRVHAWAHTKLLKGLRPMLQDIGDTDWILRPACAPALRAMVSAGLRFDALVQPRHLPMLLRLHQDHPDLPLIVDHAAKPAIAQGEWQPWADDIRRVARETPAYCKLSGLVTEAARLWRVDDLRRYTRHLVECFTPQRLVWGSDWPVVNLAGGYQRWRQATAELLAELSAADRDAILGRNAMAFYGLVDTKTNVN